MVDALGDTGHSVYLTPQMVREERSLMRGEYVGVGLEIEPKNDGVQIVAPLDNSPAIAAGLHAGEQILKINGDSVAGMDIARVVGLIIGPVGTSVTLSINDPSAQKTFDVTLKRTRIRVDNVSWSRSPEPNLPIFGSPRSISGVGKEVKAALRDIEMQGMQGAVLDLRNDPAASWAKRSPLPASFCAAETCCWKRTRTGRSPMTAFAPGERPELPVVVLVDGGTASGAEIIAGSPPGREAGIRHRGDDVWNGTVLSDFRLSDGSALQLAVREWLTPSGRSIWQRASSRTSLSRCRRREPW